MRRRLVHALGLGMTLSLAAGLGPGAPSDSHARAPGVGSEAAVRQVLTGQQDAWNRGDLKGFMSAYWQSDSLSFYAGGDLQLGWQGTYERYRRRYQSEGHEMGQLILDLKDVSLLGPDHALVRGTWEVKRKSDQPRGLFTLILRRIPGVGWKIVHDHSSSGP